MASRTPELYAAAADPFTAVVADLAGPAWSAPSACAGWTGADVLHHVIATQAEFFARHREGFPAPPDAAAVAADPVGAWRSHERAVRDLVDDDAFLAAEFDGFFGPTTVGETFSQFYVFDLVVHRWDIARSAGLDERFTPAELDLVERSIAAMGDNLYLAGICAPAVTVPPGADRQARALAALGRRS